MKIGPEVIAFPQNKLAIIEREWLDVTINFWNTIQLFCVILKRGLKIVDLMLEVGSLCQHDPRHVPWYQ